MPNKKQAIGLLFVWCARKDLPTSRGPATTTLKTSFQVLIALRSAEWHFSPIGSSPLLVGQFKKPLMGLLKLVREKGLEPSHLAAHAPKACVSTIPPLALIFRVYIVKCSDLRTAAWQFFPKACVSVTFGDPETSL